MTDLKLRDRTIRLGDLTGAHLEDNYDAVMVFSQMTGQPTKEQFSALITLVHVAAIAGGETLTREELKALIRLPDSAALVGAVSLALGFVAAEPATGEVQRPEPSPSSATSSGG